MPHLLLSCRASSYVCTLPCLRALSTQHSFPLDALLLIFCIPAFAPSLPTTALSIAALTQARTVFVMPFLFHIVRLFFNQQPLWIIESLLLHSGAGLPHVPARCTVFLLSPPSYDRTRPAPASRLENRPSCIFSVGAWSELQLGHLRPAHSSPAFSASVAPAALIFSFRFRRWTFRLETASANLRIADVGMLFFSFLLLLACSFGSFPLLRAFSTSLLPFVAALFT